MFAAVFFAIGTFQIFAQTAPDADLYYRRTHQGEWPPAGVNPSDHSAETNGLTSGNSLPPLPHPNTPLLYNNVDPANLGKGDWIWQMSTTESHLGLSAGDVQGVINYETNLHMQWITVKATDGGSQYPSSGNPQFTADLVNRAHAAGLKIFAWGYVYGSSGVSSEINAALTALATGADGFIIDAEIEYEMNPTRRADATQYATAIKASYPTRFLAHAPFPYINSHSGFPYLEFGTNCDAVMPQAYWGAIGVSPQTVVSTMNSQWRSWQNSLTGFNTNAIKPIVPLGQSYVPVNGAEIFQFLFALETNTPNPSVSGYNGASFWDAQERTADMDAAVRAAVVGTNAPPALLGGLHRAVDTSSNAAFSFLSIGALPLKYQWRFNGGIIPGATNTTLIITNAQSTDLGYYTFVVTNNFGSRTSSPLSLLVYPPQTAVWSDNFDANTSNNWIFNKSSVDTAVTFNFDYSGLGIPSAPKSSNGTKLGLQMKVNLASNAVAAVSLSPTNQSFAGDYRLHYDAWINVNGPFPGGGLGSTEYLTGGVGTSGNKVEWPGNGSTDGYYFSANGDGGSGDTATSTADYNAYAGPTVQGVATGDYWAGTDFFARGNGHNYFVTAFPNGAAAPSVQHSAYPQQTGSLNDGTFGLAWHDVIVSKRGSTVDWVVDGVRFATISNATFTASNVFVGFWDPFSSLSSNNVINFGLVDNVRVEKPAVAPVFTTNPVAATVKLGTNIVFISAATGLPAPAYQWQFNSTNIPGATNASYALAFVAATNAGNYSVIASNFMGTATSSNALLAIIPPSPPGIQFITTSNAAVQISFTGDAYWTYAIETSTNLMDWSTLTNLTSTNGLYLFDAGPADGPQQFFRVRGGP